MTEKPDTPALMEQCSHADDLSKIRAMGELERAGATEAIDVILPLLESDDESVKSAAAAALGQLAGDRVAQVGPALEALLIDPEDLVRNSAAEALGLLRYAPARPALERTLCKDGDWVVRSSAAWALGELGDIRALAALGDALDDQSDPVRAYVATAIGQLGDAKCLPVIRRRLAVETHPQPRSELLAVALRFGDESAFDALRSLAREVSDEEFVAHVLRVIEELLDGPTPAVVLRRAAELDQRLVELARRESGLEEWTAQIQARLAEKASSTAEEK